MGWADSEENGWAEMNMEIRNEPRVWISIITDYHTALFI